MAELPQAVVWDITYACPLRCVHCYSESGRRETRQLGFDEMVRVLDAIIAMRPGLISFAGGEPLVVPGIAELVRRVSEAGIDVAVSTGGWHHRPELLRELAGHGREINVSVDGTIAEVHDRIRGRQGSFERAMNALTLLDELARDDEAVRFGISCTVTRSTFAQLDAYCTELAPRWPRLGGIDFGPVLPAGLASRPDFVAHEALSFEEMAEIGSATFAGRLQALAPPSVPVTTDDYLHFRMDTAPSEANAAKNVMFVEPDGEVRAMPMYEGTVGNLRRVPGAALWSRCVTRWADPFVTETLAPVRTMDDWAAAIRRIDRHFGTGPVLARLDRRPDYALVPAR